jgi:eukaryotic-like serine/threonine-protein kinase
MKLCLVCNFQFEDEQELCPKDYSKLVPLGKDQLIGKVIQDRYRIDSVIAKGSMGVVYKATQELIGREVAVKVLHGYLVDDEESIKRFHKEAKAASRLNHPNITTLYDYGVLGRGQPYIVMDLLRGSSLADTLKQRDYLPLDEALVIFRQVCDALGEAHKRGVVHRDIKPENIMLDYTDKGVNVKVVDFGIAKFLQEADDTIGKITKTGTVCGSPTYMSPEQCDDNKVDHRSDLYSLGVVLYETITGRVPFSNKDIYAVMTMHVKENPAALKQIRPDLDFPSYLQAVVDKALTKSPDGRYQSAQEFFESLQGKPVSNTARLTTTGGETARAGGIATITEDEVSSVVARALQKKMAQAQSGDEPPIANRTAEGIPSIDPEAVKKKLAAATQELLSRRSSPNDSSTSNKPNIRPPDVGFASRIFAFFQQVFPVMLTVSLAVVLFVVLGNKGFGNLNLGNVLGTKAAQTGKGTATGMDVDDLIAQNKWEQARSILEKRKKEGKLDDEDQANLNSVYIRLAKKEAKARHYKAAVALLDQVVGEERDGDDFKQMLKKWKVRSGGK